jgi:hypothetical protein
MSKKKVSFSLFVFLFSFVDPEDPDYRRELQRPSDVKEDMRQMESRQRVSSILNSQAFREELESIIADQLKHGPHPASIIALQQISELLLPNAAQSRWHQVSAMGKGKYKIDLAVFLCDTYVCLTN